MIRFCLLMIAFFLISTLSAQEEEVEHRALNLTIKDYGISIGNSARTNGLRINFRDRQLEKVNGVNVTLWYPKDGENPDAVINGMAIGLIHTHAYSINGMSLSPGFSGNNFNGMHIAILGGGVENNITGFGFGGLGIGGGGNMKGVVVGGLGAGFAGNVTGIGIGGLGIGCGQNIKGIGIGGIGIGCGENITGIGIGGVGVGCGGDIKGIGIGGIGVGAGNSINGLALSAGMVKTPIFKGVAFASYVNVNEFRGLSIAIFNRAKELKGVQLGVVNYAGNNPKLLRLLPLVNMNF